jgi:ribosomal protein L16 Arg81 hydroxylase
MINIGISRGDFFREYFEKDFYLARGALASADYSWADVNELLYITEPGAPNTRLFSNGEVEESEYIETYFDLGIQRKRVIKRAFYETMARGGTLVMNRLEVKSSKIRRLCMSIAELCGRKTIANGYVTKFGSGSFGKHWDTHDVFAVQLFGRKQWKLFKPTMELPTRNQTSKNVKETCPDSPVFDGILEQGDILYVPRGWWHEVSPIGEETFHLAIGVHGPNLIDYATWCCSKYLADFVDCRKSANFYDSSSNDLASVAKIIANVVSNPLVFEEYQRTLITQERLNTPFNLDMFLDNEGGITDDSVLAINSNIRGDCPRQFLPTNGVESGSGCARSILELLRRDGNLSVVNLAKQLQKHQLAEIRECVRNLLSQDVLTMTA